MSTNKDNLDFDLLIAGAGPAGCTLAIKLAGKGLRIGIVEKDRLPGSKICGDALSGKVLNILKRMPDGIFQDFISNVEKTPSFGIRFIAPNLKTLDLPFSQKQDKMPHPPGFVCKRKDFDQFLFSKISGKDDIRIIAGEKINAIIRQDDRLVVHTENHRFSSKMIAGADGVHSLVRKSLSGHEIDKKHFCIGIRGYFENVKELHPDNFIELIFLKDLLPGYFWIFPTTGGRVNAGFGMMHHQVLKRKVNLSAIFQHLIHNHPLLAPRFAGSTLAGKLQTHRLPMGTYRFDRSGDRFILLGDAAFLVDPFSGEGIGNAMASGEIASSVLLDCFQKNDLSGEALSAYDSRIEKRFGQEFKTTGIMQKLARHPSLINLVVGKALKNDDLKGLLSAMFTSEDVKKKLTRPAFYTGLLFR